MRFSFFRQRTDESRESYQSSLLKVKIENLFKVFDPTRFWKRRKEKHVTRRETDNSISESESGSPKHPHAVPIYNLPLPSVFSCPDVASCTPTDSVDFDAEYARSIDIWARAPTNQHCWRSQGQYNTDRNNEDTLGAAVYPPLPTGVVPASADDHFADENGIDLNDHFSFYNQYCPFCTASTTCLTHQQVSPHSQVQDESINDIVNRGTTPPWTKLNSESCTFPNQSPHTTSVIPGHRTATQLSIRLGTVTIDEDGNPSTTSKSSNPEDIFSNPSSRTRNSISNTQKTSETGDTRDEISHIDPRLLEDTKNVSVDTDAVSPISEVNRPVTRLHHGEQMSMDLQPFPSTYPGRIDTANTRELSQPNIRQRKRNRSAREHVCQKCREGFGTRQLLRRHSERKHRSSIQIICPHPNCDRTYPALRKSEMKRHLQDKHEDPKFSCPNVQCKYSRNGEKKGFSRKENLVRHQKTCKSVG